MNAVANAIKASGVVVQVEPAEFLKIAGQSEKPLIVYAPTKVIRTTHKYLTSYKGLAFYTKANDPLVFKEPVEMVTAKKISIPDM
ncbi:MAG: hypothetical protein AAF564_24945 [Bacteroidota bacterium]